jgi:hypothetical protein
LNSEERKRLEMLVSRLIKIAEWEEKARKYLAISRELKGLRYMRDLGLVPSKPLRTLKERIEWAKNVEKLFRQWGLVDKDLDTVKLTLSLLQIIESLGRLGILRR